MNLDAARTRSYPRGDYEEYHPYGSTAWWAGASSTVSQKRYRFTGMERDDETGLQCHGVRYYATWLGRWVSADPIGLGDGVNRYGYCHGGVIGQADTTGLRPGSGGDLNPGPRNPEEDRRKAAATVGAAAGLLQLAVDFSHLSGIGPIIDYSIGYDEFEEITVSAVYRHADQMDPDSAASGAAVGFFAPQILPSADLAALGARGFRAAKEALNVIRTLDYTVGMGESIGEGAREGSAMLQFGLRKLKFDYPALAEKYFAAANPEGFKPPKPMRTAAGDRRFADWRAEFTEVSADGAETLVRKAVEIKTGVVRATQHIRAQIARDGALIREGKLNEVHWVSYENAAGEGGFTDDVLELLAKEGISWESVVTP